MEFRLPVPDQLDENGFISLSWKSLLKDFLCHLSTKEKESDRKLCSLFLHIIGSEANKLYEGLDLVGIDILKLKSLLAIIEDICVPKLFLLFERYKFFNLKQDQNEFLPQFLIRLESLANNCEFGDLQKILLAQRATEGIRDQNIQQHLKSTNQLDYSKVFEICTNGTKEKRLKKDIEEEKKDSESGNSTSVLISNDIEPTQTEHTDCASSTLTRKGSNSEQIPEAKNISSCIKSETKWRECKRQEKIPAKLNLMEKHLARTTTQNAMRARQFDIYGMQKNACNDDSPIHFSANKVLLEASKQKSSLTCEHCNMHFRNPSLLKRHLVKHSVYRPYPCEICGQKYKTRSAAKDHMKTHNNQRDFICSVCGSAFFKNDALKVHQRIHTGEKPYRCETCNQTFSYRTSLTVHMNSHNKRVNEKSFKYTCETCGKSFCRKPTFQNHLRVHTGEKPYSCSKCDKKFTSKPYLTLHTRIHSQDLPFVCDVCGKQFRHATNLHTHKKGRHSGRRSFVCDACGATYLYLKNLKQHKNCVHGIGKESKA